MSLRLHDSTTCDYVNQPKSIRIQNVFVWAIAVEFVKPCDSLTLTCWVVTSWGDISNVRTFERGGVVKEFELVNDVRFRVDLTTWKQ
mmetsp:Transcript_16303/g.35495  ORF Transcript_16303/g.35495 Transcript_16303/m.35495 type:complete len:87 (-) Transcript_16303:543-803(-)